MKFLAFQLLVVATCTAYALGFGLFAQDFDDEWQAWKTTHKKTYDDEREETKRRLVWQENLEFIVKHNLEHQRGLHSYRLGMNEFGDMEHEEFNAIYIGMKAVHKNRTEKAHSYQQQNVKLPDAVDWRTKGYVTRVKKQGACGSGWAFSATGALEALHFNRTGKLTSLSAQNLVDCDVQSHGCNGGWSCFAFDYVRDAGGIDTWKSYPYEDGEAECRFDPSHIGATCSGHVELPEEDESALQEAVATVRPVSSSVDARSRSFKFYESGVYDEPDCAKGGWLHPVLVVGYDTTNDTGEEYYIVKNSFGKSWGIHGYIWMPRNKNNKCGIASDVGYPIA